MTAELITDRLAALAHPARFAIVQLLVRAGPAGMPAGRLAETLGIAANAMTFHLQKLSRVGLVTSTRAGQFIIYCASFAELRDMADRIVGACCAESSEKCGPDCVPNSEARPAFFMPTATAAGGYHD